MKKIVLLLIFFNFIFAANIFADKKDDAFQKKYEEARTCIEKQDYKNAYKHLQKILDKDTNKNRLCNAKLLLVPMYFDGIGIKQDLKKAYEYCEYIVENDENKENVCNATLLLLPMYFYGWGTEQNYKKACECSKYIVANDTDKENVCIAKALLSALYFYGFGVDKNYKQVFNNCNYVIKNSSDKNTISICKLILGLCYSDGFGVQKNYGTAHKNFNYIVENCSDSALLLSAKYILATFYFRGLGVVKSYKKAKEYCEDVLNLENYINEQTGVLLPVNETETKLILAEICFNGGIGVEKDRKKSFSLYKEALNDGNKDALYPLGLLYCYRFSDEVDFIKGVNYIKEAADLGYKSAKNCVNDINKTGIVKKFIGLENLVLFDKDKENNILDKGDTRVFQVLGDGLALATIFEKNNLTVVLVIGNAEENFYDDQKIEISNDKKIKQIGIYKYKTKDGYDKTVPAVVIQK